MKLCGVMPQGAQVMLEQSVGGLKLGHRCQGLILRILPCLFVVLQGLLDRFDGRVPLARKDFGRQGQVRFPGWIQSFKQFWRYLPQLISYHVGLLRGILLGQDGR